MDTSTPVMTHRQALYLEVLAFNFLQHARYEPAQTLYAALQALKPNEAKYRLAEAYLKLQTDRFHEAFECSKTTEHLAQTFNMQYFACLIGSKALWRLGQEEEAQKRLVDFLQTHRDAQPHAASTPHN